MPSTAPLLLFRIRRLEPTARWAATTLLGLLLVFLGGPAHAQRWAARPAAALSEAQNETATPGLSRHVHDAQRITGYLTDALCLSTAQQLALQHSAVAERTALLLAVSDEEAQHAQARYLASVRRVLACSQLRTYVQLRQQLEGTLLPLDGLGLAAR